MNYKIKSLICIAFSSITLFSFAEIKPIDPKKEKKLLEIINNILQKNHYNPASIDDSFSKSVFKNYINSLDPNKRIFLESDIDEFKEYDDKIDNLLKDQDLSFFYMTHDRLKKRLKEAKLIYSLLIKNEIDYTIDEVINVDFSKDNYAKNTNELELKWKKQLKFFVLDTIVKKLKAQKNNQTNIDFIKNFKEIEIESRANVFKELNSNESNFELLERDFYFDKYVNAIISEFDPHSEYLIPSKKDDFDMKISGKNVGVGLKLSSSNNFIEVKEIILGSNAWKNKKIEVGDVILKISDKNNNDIDVVGFNLVDVNKLMKGQIGSTVKITTKKLDGTIKSFSLKREIIEYKDSYVKSCIVSRYNEKIGIIDLPKFYKDIENENQKDAAKDVAFEIENLKKAGIKGLIIDLRDNGGGLVETAVEIAGMFIEQGPIVQIKSNSKIQETLFDTNSSVLWIGPVIIMINKNSASATEIFAAAIQDYKRGIIVGGQQSFGKGTVQSTIDLNQFNAKKEDEDFGALKLTIQKYYRINGGSTQIKGVSSDIVMPDAYAFKNNYGEKNEHNVLKWDKINAIDFKKWNNEDAFKSIIENSQKRISENPTFKAIEQKVKLKSNQRELKSINLNFEKNRLIQVKLDAEFDKFEYLKKYSNFLIFKSTNADLSVLKKNTVLNEKRNQWHESLMKDVYIEESLNIMSEMLKVLEVDESKIISKQLTRKNNVKTKGLISSH